MAARGRRRRDERGAVALFTALALTVVLVISAFAVDLGMQRVLRRDLQALADAVATDLARELDGRSAEDILADPGWTAARADSVARNDAGIGSTPVLDVQVGIVDAAYSFTAKTDQTVATAVRVVATADVDFAFAPGDGSATRSALTVARAQSCYKLGSWGARLTTPANANLVYRVLAAHGVGGSVGAATYQGLVGAHVDAADLATALGLASPEQLATASFSLGTLLDATASVIADSGSTTTQVAALDAIRTGTSGIGARPVALSTLFSVASGAGTGLTAGLDVADLVIGSILVADGNEAVVVDLGLSALGFTVDPVSVGLIQGSRTACGYAGATPNQSNQVSAELGASLDPSALTSLLSGLTGFSVAPEDITLEVSSSTATSSLEEVRCGRSVRSVTVETSGGLVSGTLTVPLRITYPSLVPPFSRTVAVTITAELTPSGSPATVTIAVPSQDYDTPYSNGGTAAALPDPEVETSGLPAGVQTLVEDIADDVVSPFVASLNATILRPLSDVAGLQTAGADVLLLDRPTCTTPALRG